MKTTSICRCRGNCINGLSLLLHPHIPSLMLKIVHFDWIPMHSHYHICNNCGQILLTGYGHYASCTRLILYVATASHQQRSIHCISDRCQCHHISEGSGICQWNMTYKLFVSAIRQRNGFRITIMELE